MAAILLALPALALGLTTATPEQAAAVRGLEGEWGLLASASGQPPPGLLGVAACGQTKSLRLNVRQEETDDGRMEWRLRIHPDQPFGVPVVGVEIRDGVSIVVVAPPSAGVAPDRETFERSGNRLTLTFGRYSAQFRRCVPPQRR